MYTQPLAITVVLGEAVMTIIHYYLFPLLHTICNSVKRSAEPLKMQQSLLVQVNQNGPVILNGIQLE